MVDYFSNLKTSYYKVIPFALGIYFILKKSLNILSFAKQYFLTSRKNFLSIYGNGWVFITGSSKGIGKSFAKKFAESGFNILLSSRNIDNLKQTKEELSLFYPNIQIDYFVFDYSYYGHSNTYDELTKTLDNYDISILINNVGVYSCNFFEKISDDEIFKMINTNVISSTMVTKICLEKMKIRKNKSLIVFSGSDLTLYTPPFTQVYTGTKAYLKGFVKSLSQENDYVDFTVLDFGPVNTNLNTKKIPFKVNSDDCVEKSMSQIGNYQYSHGHYLHALKYALFGNKFMMWMFTRASLKSEFDPK